MKESNIQLEKRVAVGVKLQIIEPDLDTPMVTLGQNIVPKLSFEEGLLTAAMLQNLSPGTPIVAKRNALYFTLVNGEFLTGKNISVSVQVVLDRGERVQVRKRVLFLPFLLLLLLRH
jgi:TctA family transporter